LFAHSTVRALAAHFTSADTGSSVRANAVRAQRQREALSAQRNLRRERK